MTDIVYRFGQPLRMQQQDNTLGSRPIFVPGKDVLMRSSARELRLGQPEHEKLSARVFWLDEFDVGFRLAVGHYG
jgi:hypothetical protein